MIVTTFLDPLFGVVLTNGFGAGETLLTFGTEGNVFTGFDLITGFLHELQKLVVVLCHDDKPVNGLFELLLPTCAAFGFGVFLVAHPLVL